MEQTSGSLRLKTKKESPPTMVLPEERHKTARKDEAEWVHIVKRRFVALDIETTGLSPYRDAIVEIAAVRFVNGEETDKFVTLVNPQRPIPFAAYNIHKISNAMVKNAPLMHEVIGPLLDFLGDDIVVGHNVTFDLGFIEHAARQYGYDPNIEYIDTRSVARQAWRGLPNYKLQTVLSAIGYKPHVQHRAEDDCRGCAEIILKALRGEPATYIPISAPEREPYFMYVSARKVAARTVVCEANPAFKGRHFTFTGQFENITREYAYERVFAGGGFVNDSVTLKTDYLVNADGRESTKTRRAMELIKIRGKNIQIITAEEFLAMLE